MLEKDFIVVGSGIVGCVVAHELKEHGKNVKVLERRKHIGGNLYDFTDEYGIHVHLYGPHIFHTNEKFIWEYVSRFCKWVDYNLVCGSVMDGKCVRTSFDFSSVDTFFPDEAREIKDHIKQIYGERESATVLEMLDCTDSYVHRFAQFLYDKDYKLYTAKQWGISPDEIDRQIFKRVPILFSYGSKYFNDTYQAMPVNGYMEMIDNLLDGIEVLTDVDALDHIDIKDNLVLFDGQPCESTVIYTGPIDELFNCQFGKLPYRSLRFEWKHRDIDSFQDMPVVAYPQAKDFTRITEYKKLPYQDVKGTTYAIEYPVPYRKGESNEPYYPVLTEESQRLYSRYRELADKVKGLYCCGRLADFKYYNMDQAIKSALEFTKKIEENQ